MKRMPVDQYGVMNPNDVAQAITDRTVLVSVMFANNEVGTIQPVAEIAQVCHERGVYFHTDAVQAVGKLPIDCWATLIYRDSWGICQQRCIVSLL
jgi:cysteine desulfurase